MDARVVHTIAGEAGRSWWGPGDMYTFLVTGEESGGSLFALDCLVGAGGGPPPHRHLAEDELFTITEGRMLRSLPVRRRERFRPASPFSSPAGRGTSIGTRQARPRG